MAAAPAQIRVRAQQVDAFTRPKKYQYRLRHAMQEMP